VNLRNLGTTAALATATLVAAGGVAFALGSVDVPTVVAQPASLTTDAAPTTSSPPPTTSATEVPLAEAREIAVARVGGGEVTKVETEIEHGRLEWKIEVVRDGVAYDVRVDATTGDVTRVDGGSAPSTSTPPAPAPPTTTDDHHRNRGGDDHRGDDRGRHGDDDRVRHGGEDHGDRHGGHGRG
jgi:hypothetical protein